MSTDHLRDLQIQVQDLIRNGERTESPLFREHPGSASSAPGLEAYQVSYVERLAGSLREDFPRVFQYLSGEEAQDLLITFVQHHPSQSWTLAEYSGRFPFSLRGHSLLAKFPFLADLAEFEWHKVLSPLDQPPKPFNFGILEAWTAEEWENAQIVLNPGIRFFESRWSLLMKSSEDRPLTASNELQHYATFQNSLGQVKQTELISRELALISAIQEKTPLWELETKMCHQGFVEEEVTRLIADWVQAGLIEKVTHLSDNS